MNAAALAADTELVDCAQLRTYFSHACQAFDAKNFRLITQKFLVTPTGHNAPYDGAKSLVRFLEILTTFGWQPDYDQGQLVGVRYSQHDSASQTMLGAGGQLTYISPYLPDAHQLAAAADKTIAEWARAAELLDLNLLSLGYQPLADKMANTNSAIIKRPQYSALLATASRQSPEAGAALNLTASTALRLPYSDEQDAARKFKVALALEPIATALFSTSPLQLGGISTHMASRTACRLAADVNSKSLYRLVFDQEFSFSAYTDYILAQPLAGIWRHGKFIPLPYADLASFVNGDSADNTIQTPVIADWQTHLAMQQGEVRLTPELHISGADALPTELLHGFIAFWLGIIADSNALKDCEKMIADWRADELLQLRHQVCLTGLKTPFKGTRLDEWATEAVRFSQQGLRRRAVRLNGGSDETRYMEQLFIHTESAQNLADDIKRTLQSGGLPAVLSQYQY